MYPRSVWLPPRASAPVSRAAALDTQALVWILAPVQGETVASPVTVSVLGTGFEGNACCAYLDRTSVHRWSGGTSKTYLLAALADGAAQVGGGLAGELSGARADHPQQVSVRIGHPGCGHGLRQRFGDQVA